MRSRFLLAALVLTHVSVAGAQYPEKPITFVVPFAAGQRHRPARARARPGSDGAARSRPVVVDNKAGASGFIGAQQVAKAAPDGYTVFITTNTTHAANEHLFKTIPVRSGEGLRAGDRTRQGRPDPAGDAEHPGEVRAGAHRLRQGATRAR